MAPERAAFKRCLLILRRLARGPADRGTLSDFVEGEYDGEAYDGNATPAGKKRFDNDIKQLREWGVDIAYDGDYHLQSYGDFDPVALDDSELNTLAFLAETFAPGSVNANAVQQLIRRVADWLPEHERLSLAARRQRWRIDLERKDDDVIDPAVQERIERAIAQHRLLRFGYKSPGQADGTPRVHTVQPWHLLFDTASKHLYLDAYRVEVLTSHGPWRDPQWSKYRLGRIQADGIEILPEKFPATPPKRPRYQLEYLLSPEIARLGEISHHFDDLAVHETDGAGWVRVTATTDDLFRATRLLMSYAHNCKLIGGPEARREMGVLVEAVARMYGVIPSES